MKKIEIYSTPTCYYCVLAKDFMKKKGIAFTEYNVGMDLEKRKEMVEISGQMGVPVVKIDSEVFVGFNEELLKEKLGL
ncbi:MAG: glutaredoxin family protein [bacterium]